MKVLHTLLVFGLALLSPPIAAEQQCVQKSDLRPTWKVFSDNKYNSFSDDDKTTTVYIGIDARTYRGDILRIISEQPVSIFLNGKLLEDAYTEFNFSIDSIVRVAESDALLLAIHGQSTIKAKSLQTVLCTLRQVDGGEASLTEQLRNTSFRDFVLMAALVVLAVFVTVLQLNPRLSADYFSVTKLLMLRENEEDQSFSRGTSANILVYLFASLLTSLFLMIMVNLGKVELPWISISSFSTSFFSWALLALALFAILLIKLFIIYITSLLFKINHLTSYHFFNFIRLLVITVGLMTMASVIYFISYGSGDGLYNFLSGAFAWILVLWSALIFLKLLRKVSFSVFHLFSYICATEVVPILFLLNKLYE